MYKGGDKVRVVRADGVRWLRVGAILEAAQDQPRNEEFIRVVRPGELECVIRSERVVMHEQHPNNAPVQPVVAPVAVPAPPAKVVGVFAVGDRVVIARGDQPRHVNGIRQEMRDMVGNGEVYQISQYEPNGGRPFVELEGQQYTWDIRMLDHEEHAQAPAIIPQAAPAPVVPIKQGPIAYADVIPGMRAVFVGGGTAPLVGGFQVGQEVEVISHYRGNREAWRVKHPDHEPEGVGCYRDNFHHAPPKEIVVGSLVRVIEPFGEMNRGRELIVTNVVNNAGGVLLQFGHNQKQWRKARFELVAHPKPAPEPEPVVDEAELVVKMPFKAGDKVKIWKKEQRRITWYAQNEAMFKQGRAYVIKNIDDYNRVTLEGEKTQFDLGCFIKPIEVPKGADLRKRFACAEGNYHHGSLCSFAYISKHNGETFNLTGPCHANLATGYLTEIVIGTVAMEAQSNHVEEMKRYHAWLANESPWAPSFTTKDVAEAYREGGFIMNTDQPKSHVVGACIAARAGHEHEGRLPTFIHFMDKGYSGSVAFLMSLKVGWDSEGKQFTETDTSGSHDCINSKMGYTQTLDFFAKGFPDQGDKPCKDDGAGYRVAAKIDSRYQGDYFDESGIPKAEQYGTMVADQLTLKVIGEGWDKTTVATNESVYALADKFTQYIKEQA